MEIKYYNASRDWQKLPQNFRDIFDKYHNSDSIPVGQIAIDLGLSVMAVSMPSLISGEIRPDKQKPGSFVIIVNSDDPKPRQRFTVAHEIAHFLLHKDMIGNGIEDNVLYRSKLSNPIEAEANRLAADILMPPFIIERYKKGYDLQNEEIISQIAQILGVSMEALKIKLGLRN